MMDSCRDLWVLKALKNNFADMSDGYYTGKSYIYQNCKYAVVDKDINAAKKYSSYGIALSACNRMGFENYSFDVEQLSDTEI